jgi:hypothetical protein
MCVILRFCSFYMFCFPSIHINFLVKWVEVEVDIKVTVFLKI